MKRLFGVGALALISAAFAASAAMAQEPCAYSKAYGYNGQPSLSGLVCMSREAAIAAARHYRDQTYEAKHWIAHNVPGSRPWHRRLTRDDIVMYVNGVRREDACINITDERDAEFAHMVTQPNQDQFGRRLQTSFWQYKAPGVSATLVAANYADTCRSRN